MPTATLLTDVVDVTGVWTSCIAIIGGAYAARALLSGRPDADSGQEATKGMGVGFILGVPITIAVLLLPHVL